MEEQTYTATALFVLCGSYLRVAAALGAALRTLQSRGLFLKFQMGWVEAVVTPEPVVLAVVTSLLAVWQLDRDAVSALEVAGAAVGAALVLAAWGLTLWSFLSWRTIFFGHGVREDQELVTTGAYGFVRHPVYLGVLMIWLGLAATFLSATALLVAAVYVIPMYVLYMLSEEKMMVDAFRDAYRGYRRAVPMLIPYFPPRAKRS